MSTPSDDTLLVDLVAQALAAQERGETVDVAGLCRAHPRLETPLREALGLEDAIVAGARGQRTEPADGAETDALAGRVLADRYTLVRRIGMGAMGAVFRGQDRVLGREVAVKVLDPVLFQGGGRRERFHREARAAASLKHNSIVAVHDHGDGELPFIVMDLVDGRDLATVLAHVRRRAEDTGLSPKGAWIAEALGPKATLAPFDAPYPWVVARLLLAAAQALAAAHDKGVLHRDVKPSNILLTPAGEVVLVDFGLASLPGEATLARGSGPLGTPWYMAPEQAGGKDGTVGPVADVYALGSTLYHLLALRPPFEDEPARVLVRIQTEDPPALRRIAPAVPRDLAVICGKAMEKRPADRYASMAALAADLEAFLDLRPIAAVPPSPLGRVVRFARRRPASAAALALGVVALTAGAIAWSASAVLARAERLRDAEVLRRTVPALITLEGDPRTSLFELNRQDADGLATLDRILELDPDDDFARLCRAVLHLDAGTIEPARTARGLDDLEVLRDRHPESVALRAPIDALRAPAVAESRATWSVDLPLRGVATDGAPVSAFDHFVRGYWLLRASKQDPRWEAALAELDRALDLDPSLTAARDLRLLTLLGAGRWDEALEQAWQLEGRYGGPTARTRHAIAAALVMKNRPREAIAAAEASLRLRPDRHGPLQNMGVAYFKLGDYHAARDCFVRARAARPEIFNTAEMLSRTYRALGEFDNAEKAAALIPEHTPEARARKKLQQANRFVDEALVRSADGDLEAARALCRKARPLLEEARADAPERLQREIDQTLTTARHLASGQWDAILAERLELALLDPDEDPHRLAAIAGALLKTQAAPELVVLHYLHRAHQLAPDDRRILMRYAVRLLALQRVAAAADVLVGTVGRSPWSDRDHWWVHELLRQVEPDVRAQLAAELLRRGADVEAPPRLANGAGDDARTGALPAMEHSSEVRSSTERR